MPLSERQLIGPYDNLPSVDRCRRHDRWL